jgi:hypothetical protein
MRSVLAPALAVVLPFAVPLRPVAAQEAVIVAVEAGAPAVEELELLTAGRTLALAAGDRIVLGYVDSCVVETIAGPGSVLVRDRASELEGAELVTRRTVDCRGRPEPGTSAGEGAAVRLRGARPIEERARDMLADLRARRAGGSHRP